MQVLFKWQLRIVRAVATVLLVVIVAVGGLSVLARVQSSGTDAELFGHSAFVMSTGSMEPTIPVGSLLFLKRLTAAQSRQLHTGDVVTFHPAAGPADVLVTHRVVAIRRNNVGSTSSIVYTTKGDANQSVDLTPLDPSRVIGIYAGHVPFAGRLVQGFGQWRVIALVVFSLLLAQFALERRPLRGMNTKEKIQT